MKELTSKTVTVFSRPFKVPGKVPGFGRTLEAGEDDIETGLVSREIGPTRALNDVARERRCLRCKTVFPSEGFGERICRHCKGLNAWRNAAPVSPGTSRRR